jgi:hypothetical protein
MFTNIKSWGSEHLTPEKCSLLVDRASQVYTKIKGYADTSYILFVSCVYINTSIFYLSIIDFLRGQCYIWTC